MDIINFTKTQPNRKLLNISPNNVTDLLVDQLIYEIILLWEVTLMNLLYRQTSDVRLTVKSVRFRFQKINRNRNRDLEKNRTSGF